MDVTLAGSALTRNWSDEELQGISIDLAAFDGQIGTSTFPVPDPTGADEVPPGLSLVVEEGSTLLLSGIIVSEGRSRGFEPNNPFKKDDYSVEDPNTFLFGFRVLASRPEETDYDRIQWFFDTYLPTADTTFVLNTDTTTMIAADYQSDGVADIMRDAIDITGKTLFLHDKATGGLCAHWHALTAGHTCGLTIDDTNRATDGPTTWYPQNPSRVRDGHDLTNDYLAYGADQLGPVSVSDGTSISTYDVDGKSHQAFATFPEATDVDTLTADANRLLATNKDPRDTWTCTIGPLDETALALIRVGDIITCTSTVMTLTASPQRIASLRLTVAGAQRVAPTLWMAELTLGAPVRGPGGRPSGRPPGPGTWLCGVGAENVVSLGLPSRVSGHFIRAGEGDYELDLGETSPPGTGGHLFETFDLGALTDGSYDEGDPTLDLGAGGFYIHPALDGVNPVRSMVGVLTYALDRPTPIHKIGVVAGYACLIETSLDETTWDTVADQDWDAWTTALTPRPDLSDTGGDPDGSDMDYAEFSFERRVVRFVRFTWTYGIDYCLPGFNCPMDMDNVTLERHPGAPDPQPMTPVDGTGFGCRELLVWTDCELVDSSTGVIPIPPLAGDASGTIGDVTVTGITGVPVAGAPPSTGDLIVATSPTTAAWQAPVDPTVATLAAIAAAELGPAWKYAVVAATVAPGTLASTFEDGDTVDGVLLATGDRILIKDQTDATENGIYTVNASGAPTRATDADSGAEMVAAATTALFGGTNADTSWICTTSGTITLGSTDLTFGQLRTYQGLPFHSYAGPSVILEPIRFAAFTGPAGWFIRGLDTTASGYGGDVTIAGGANATDGYTGGFLGVVGAEPTRHGRAWMFSAGSYGTEGQVALSDGEDFMVWGDIDGGGP